MADYSVVELETGVATHDTDSAPVESLSAGIVVGLADGSAVSELDYDVQVEAIESASAAADTIAPVVSGFSPPPGTTIATGDAIQFDVTDDSGAFSRIFAVARFLGVGTDEVVHDGDAFTARYAPQSNRVPIANGFRYTVRRYGGWPDSPQIRVYPIDGSGNQA